MLYEGELNIIISIFVLFFNHRGSTKMSSSGQSRVMLVKVNASPPVCRDLAISCFGISNSIPNTTER